MKQNKGLQSINIHEKPIEKLENIASMKRGTHKKVRADFIFLAEQKNNLDFTNANKKRVFIGKATLFSYVLYLYLRSQSRIESLFCT